MAEPPALHLVVAHLDDDLGPHGRLLELATAPAVRLREAALGRVLEERQDDGRDLVVPRGCDRGGADVVEVAVVAPEAEQERRDPPLAIPFPAQSGDDAVGRLLGLHLHDRGALARAIRLSRRLAITPSRPIASNAVEPLDRLAAIAGAGREHEARASSSSFRRRASEPPASARRVPDEQVEGDEGRGDLRREPPHTAPADGASSASRRSRARRPARSRSRRRGRNAAGAALRAARARGSSGAAAARSATTGAARRTRSRGRPGSRPASARTATVALGQLADELRLHRREGKWQVEVGRPLHGLARHRLAAGARATAAHMPRPAEQCSADRARVVITVLGAVTPIGSMPIDLCCAVSGRRALGRSRRSTPPSTGADRRGGSQDSSAGSSMPPKEARRDDRDRSPRGLRRARRRRMCGA